LGFAKKKKGGKTLVKCPENPNKTADRSGGEREVASGKKSFLARGFNQG